MASLALASPLTEISNQGLLHDYARHLHSSVFGTVAIGVAFGDWVAEESRFVWQTPMAFLVAVCRLRSIDSVGAGVAKKLCEILPQRAWIGTRALTRFN